MSGIAPENNPVVSIKVAITGEDLLACRELTVSGRPAWALAWLAERGAAGCTPIEYPGPRWSDYVFKLKKHGLDIVTHHEQHGGAFAGNHARYVLQTSVRVLEVKRRFDRAVTGVDARATQPTKENSHDHAGSGATRASA